MSSHVKRNYRNSAQDARLLVKQCDKLDVAVSDAQRACAKKGGEPCHLASCPRCRKRLSNSASRAVIERYSEKGELQWVTITPAAGRVELHEAVKFDVKRLHELVRRKLRETLPQGTEIVGALDVSMNLHENSGKHLQFHFHAFVWPPLNKAAREKSAKRFRRDRKLVSKPVVFQTITADTLERRAKYTFKWFHQRRSSFAQVTHDDGIEVRPRAKKQSLQAPERVLIHDGLRSYVVTDLLLLMGVKRIRSAGTGSVELMKVQRGDGK